MCLLTGCFSSESFKGIAGEACTNSSQCPSSESCFDGECLPVECQSNTECLLQHRCDEGICSVGCDVDGDCLAGEHCLEGSCSTASCRDSELDCSIGEHCLEGNCEADENLCEVCDFEAWQQGGNLSEVCVIFTYNHEERCDWQNNYGCPEHMSCFPADGEGDTVHGFCVESFYFPTCENSSCPRGFSCTETEGVDFCLADCLFFKAEGLLP